MSIKAVVFDMGGVFLDWNPRYLYQKLFKDSTKLEFFLTSVCNPEWNLRQDGGRSFEDAVTEVAATHPQYREMAELYLSRWPEMIGSLIEGTVAITRALKARGMPLYLLSNCSAETFPLVVERYDFPALFDGLVISGEIRLLKPEAAIYHHLLDRFGLDARDCLFIDDVAANIQAASELGFATHLFQRPEDLARRLVDDGCLEASDLATPALK